MKPLFPTRPNPAISFPISANSLFQISHFFKATFHSSDNVSSSRRHEVESRNVKVSVWWDFENCNLPTGSNLFRVTQSINAAIRANGIKGPIQITAFGDLMQMSRVNQDSLSSTGITFTHVPNGGKNSADRSLLVDLMYWVSRNPPPAHLFLISGDRDFASILHRLRMNNYNILLASLEIVPNALSSAASIIWQWNALISGENLNGKRFNQPPDGPHGSWYGHYKAPLEDPFMTSEQKPPLVPCRQDRSDTPKASSVRKVEVTKISFTKGQKQQRSAPSPCSVRKIKSSSTKLQEAPKVEESHKGRKESCVEDVPVDAHSIIKINTGSQVTGSHCKPGFFGKLWKKIGLGMY
ncbi:unnamed protein product [Cuscuta epithymum]|uniref:NYN domain-containing protein n=1 Tax=Cuscuta epithymum TaxID=186058 RepID=A0AAV0DJV4_9ASTE|nr:unnamed protein product [Cuscuta epithymum]